MKPVKIYRSLEHLLLCSHYYHYVHYVFVLVVEHYLPFQHILLFFLLFVIIHSIYGTILRLENL